MFRVHGDCPYFRAKAARMGLPPSFEPTVPHAPDDRPPFVKAIEWSARITAVGLQMVLPALVGYWLDTRLGTKGVFVLLGAVLGFASGMVQIIRWGRAHDHRDDNRSSSRD